MDKKKEFIKMDADRRFLAALYFVSFTFLQIKIPMLREGRGVSPYRKCVPRPGSSAFLGGGYGGLARGLWE